MTLEPIHGISGAVWAMQYGADKFMRGIGAGDHIQGAAASPDDQHFYLVDLFRGAAALSVLVWHYQHFYLPRAGAAPAFSSRAEQPLYELLAPLYNAGNTAVQFFWIISGFVLASRYFFERPSALTFARNRFARLYPLHLLTLVVVAGLQWFSWQRLGHFQIYGINDPFHFLLNLGFASHWGLFEQGFSFNAPIWSVSVEVVIYAVFWIALPVLFRFGPLAPLIVALVSLTQTPHDPQGFWSCAFHFFGGAALFVIYRSARRDFTATRMICLLVIASMVWLGLDGGGARLPLAMMAFLLLLSTIEHTWAGKLARRLRWIGDNTYGTYLWHVPVQISVLIAFAIFKVPREIVNSPLFLLMFLIKVSVIARVSFVYFERPAQRYLRGR